MKKLGMVIFFVCSSMNLIAQDIRSGTFVNEEIIFRKSGILQFQNDRKYRGYLVKLTNAESKLAVGYKGGVQVWDTITHDFKLCLGDEGRTYNHIALSKNGEYLAGYREKKIFVWETNTCRVLTSLTVAKDLNHDGLAISSNGKYLFYVHDDSRLFRKREKVALWDIEQGKEIADLQPERLPIYRSGYDPLFDTESLRPADGDFSPDSRILAVQYSHRIYLWNAETGRMIHRFVDSSLKDEASHWGMYDVVLSQDGSVLVSRGADGNVRLWDVEKKQLVKTFRIGERVHGRATLSNDNRYIATSSIRGEVSVWDLLSGQVLWKGARKNFFPSFSKPSVGLISVESGEIYDLRTGEKLEGVKGEFLSDGKLLVKEKDGNMSTWVVQRN